MTISTFLKNLHAETANSRDKTESAALAKAASAGKLPDPALRMALMTFRLDGESDAFVVDLDALSPADALLIRTRLAAGLREFIVDGALFRRLQAAIYDPVPVVVQASMDILCFD